MFCAKCGKEMSDDWKVCPNCGCAVGEEPFAGPANTGNMSFQGTPVGKKKKPVFKRWWFWLIIVIVIIVIIAAVAGGSGSGKSKVVEFGDPVIVEDVIDIRLESGGFTEGRVYPYNAIYEDSGIEFESTGTMFGIYGQVQNLSSSKYDLNEVCDITLIVDEKAEADADIWLENEDRTEFTGYGLDDLVIANPDALLNGQDKSYFTIIGQVGNTVYENATEAKLVIKILTDLQDPESYVTYTIPMDVGERNEEGINADSGSSEGTDVLDLSGLDAETLIGKTVADVEAIGLPYDEEMMMASNDEVTVDFDMDNERVDMVIIDATYGDAALAPSFHGVTLGMRKEEAIEMLSDQYDAWEEDERGFVSVNTSTNETVTCRCEDGYVDAISYMVMTDEELEDFQPVVEETPIPIVYGGYSYDNEDGECYASVEFGTDPDIIDFINIYCMGESDHGLYYFDGRLMDNGDGTYDAYDDTFGTDITVMFVEGGMYVVVNSSDDEYSYGFEGYYTLVEELGNVG